MCCVPPVVLPLPGTRTVVDLREILVTLLERLCAWPLADECLDRIRMNLARAVCRGSLFWQHDRNEALRNWPKFQSLPRCSLTGAGGWGRRG